MASPEDEDLTALRNAVLASMKKRDPGDDEDDLRALREAALRTKKPNQRHDTNLNQVSTNKPLYHRRPPRPTHHFPPHQRPPLPRPGGYRHGPSYGTTSSTNLIVIQPALEQDGLEGVAAQRQVEPARTLAPPTKTAIAYPQDKWSSSPDTTAQQPRPKVSGKFSRFESRDSDSDDDSSDDSSDSAGESDHSDSSSESSLRSTASSQSAADQQQDTDDSSSPSGRHDSPSKQTSGESDGSESDSDQSLPSEGRRGFLQTTKPSNVKNSNSDVKMPRLSSMKEDLCESRNTTNGARTRRISSGDHEHSSNIRKSAELKNCGLNRSSGREMPQDVGSNRLAQRPSGDNKVGQSSKVHNDSNVLSRRREVPRDNTRERRRPSGEHHSSNRVSKVGCEQSGVDKSEHSRLDKAQSGVSDKTMERTCEDSVEMKPDVSSESSASESSESEDDDDSDSDSAGWRGKGCVSRNREDLARERHNRARAEREKRRKAEEEERLMRREKERNAWREEAERREMKGREVRDQQPRERDVRDRELSHRGLKERDSRIDIRDTEYRRREIRDRDTKEKKVLEQEKKDVEMREKEMRVRHKDVRDRITRDVGLEGIQVRSRPALERANEVMESRSSEQENRRKRRLENTSVVTDNKLVRRTAESELNNGQRRGGFVSESDSDTDSVRRVVSSVSLVFQADSPHRTVQDRAHSSDDSPAHSPQISVTFNKGDTASRLPVHQRLGRKVDSSPAEKKKKKKDKKEKKKKKKEKKKRKQEERDEKRRGGVEKGDLRNVLTKG